MLQAHGHRAKCHESNPKAPSGGAAAGGAVANKAISHFEMILPFRGATAAVGTAAFNKISQKSQIWSDGREGKGDIVTRHELLAGCCFSPWNFDAR